LIFYLSERSMPDSAKQLQRIYLAGFEIETFEMYPSAVGVVRDGVVTLLQATPDGLRMIGSPGWRMGDLMGVLVEKDGQMVFQRKSEVVEATPERLETVRRFREELEDLLTAEQ
jgi:hypothetical protein